jgi:hypothetical protein
MTYRNRIETFRSYAGLLAKIAELPDCANVDSNVSAAFLNTSRGVLANWRSMRRGPRYVKHGGSIRYQIGALKAFAEGRDDLSWDANSHEAQQKIDRPLAGDPAEAQETRGALAVHQELPEHLLEPA